MKQHHVSLRVWATCALLYVAALACAFAQTPPPTCGGQGGTGKRVGVAGPVTLTPEESAGLFVAEDGYWTVCRPPIAPPPPSNCGIDHNSNPMDGDVKQWTVGTSTCTATGSTTQSQSGARDHVILHGTTAAWSQWNGPLRGVLIESCLDGKRAVKMATCAPATVCDTGWSSTRDGRRYSYDARPNGKAVALGAYVDAVASDGSTLRLRCEAGSFVAAPQCISPQSVTRSYSTEVRVYEYTGPSIEVGARVRAEQISVVMNDGTVKKGTNRIRWTLATCSPSGRLQ